MTIAEGVSVAHNFRNDSVEPKTSRNSFSRVASRISASVSSFTSVIPTQGAYGGQLAHLTQFISQYTALYHATIVSTECYTESILFGIVHRFLLLELSRPTKKTIWLRLDRRRSKMMSDTEFILSGGSTPANDTVSMSCHSS